MKSYSWILILVLFLSGFSSCHSDAERYKDILREGSWYVYDIDYSYKRPLWIPGQEWQP